MDDIEMMYQEQILDHFKSPRNHGKIEKPSVHHHEYNPLCGDQLDFYLIIKDNKVADVKFIGKGCAISQASASMLSEQIKGQSIEKIEKLTKENILEMLGIELSPVRLKCALLSLDTVKNSVIIYEKYINK